MFAFNAGYSRSLNDKAFFWRTAEDDCAVFSFLKVVSVIFMSDCARLRFHEDFEAFFLNDCENLVTQYTCDITNESREQLLPSTQTFCQ